MSATELMIKAELLESKIKDNIVDVVYVHAVDLSDGCGSKFEVTVVSEQFSGKPLIQQHRIVHKVNFHNHSIHRL